MRGPRRGNTKAQIYILTLTAVALCLLSLATGLATTPYLTHLAVRRHANVLRSSDCLWPVNNSDGRA
jgi:hypothetical protein